MGEHASFRNVLAHLSRNCVNFKKNVLSQFIFHIRVKFEFNYRDFILIVKEEAVFSPAVRNGLIKPDPFYG